MERDETRHPYLQPDGSQKFRKATTRRFTFRNNKALLAIDDALAAYVAIPHENRVDRTAALVALIGFADVWMGGKLPKVENEESFRYPAVLALRDSAVATLKRLDHWAAAKTAFAKLVPKGSLHGRRPPYPAPPLKHLEVDVDDKTGAVRANNWLEILDKTHRRGQELKKHFAAWVQSGEKISFWKYLEKQAPAVHDDLAKVSVRYLDDHFHRAMYEATIDSGLIYSRMSPSVQSFILSRRSHAAIVAQADHQPLDTTAWPSGALTNMTSGWGCFVLSAQKVLYVGVHANGLFHHSSFLAGAPVLASGMIKVVQGRVVAIHEKNGHYQSKFEHIETFLRLLIDRLPGTDWSKVDYYTFAGTPRTVASVMNLPARPVAPPRPQRPVMAQIRAPQHQAPQAGNVRNLIGRFQNA